MPSFFKHVKFTKLVLGKEIAEATKWVHIYLDHRENHRAYHNYEEIKKVQSLYGDIAGLVCALHIVLDWSRTPDALMDWVKEEKTALTPKLSLKLTREDTLSLDDLEKVVKKSKKHFRAKTLKMGLENRRVDEEGKKLQKELQEGLMRTLLKQKEEKEVEIE